LLSECLGNAFNEKIADVVSDDLTPDQNTESLSIMIGYGFVRSPTSHKKTL
jgi:hypothetical protein